MIVPNKNCLLRRGQFHTIYPVINQYKTINYTALISEFVLGVAPIKPLALDRRMSRR